MHQIVESIIKTKASKELEEEINKELKEKQDNKEEKTVAELVNEQK